MVVGSRYAPGGKDDRTPLRVAASRAINGLATLVLGFGIRDYDSGFVVVRRSVFDKVSLIPTGFFDANPALDIAPSTGHCD